MDELFGKGSVTDAGQERPNPSLSPVFLRGDDVANFLHETFGAVGRACGRYILRTPEGYSVALEPTGDLAHAGFRSVFEKAATEVPPGYRVEGFYYSDTVSTDVQEASASDAYLGGHWFALDDLYRFIQQRATTPHFYRSNPDGSLLSFTPSGSSLEGTLFQGIDPTDSSKGPLEEQLQRLGRTGVATTSRAIKHFVQTSTVKVLIGSLLWGPPDRLNEEWDSFPQPVADPIRQSPLLSQVLPSSLAAVLFAQKRLDPDKTSRQLGFILKAKTKDAYVVSQAVVDKAPFLSAGTVFERNALGHLVLPRGFELYGLYYAHDQETGDLGSTESWLQQDFFSPVDLLMGIRRGEGIADSDKSAPLVIHLMVAEGAVLSYQSSRSEAEKKLFARREGSPVSGVEWLRQALQAGFMSPRAFIRYLSTAGDLRVVARSKLWDVLGKVTEHWRPFATFAQLKHSHGFLTADDAAQYARWKILEMPDRHAKEFGGYIIKSAHDQYFASEPMAGGVSDFAVAPLLARTRQGVPVPPEGAVLIAYYHSHTRENPHARARYKALLVDPDRTREALERALDDWDFRRCMFSVEDLVLIVTEQNFPAMAYLQGADDSLIRFTREDVTADQTLLNRLSGTGGTPADGEGAVTDRVRLMASEGELRVVVPSRLWGAAGKVSANWTRVLPSVAVDNVAPIAFGPVFSQLDAALKAVNERAQHTSELRQFAYVLKHREQRGFIVTDPRPLDRLRSLPRVFEKGADGRYVLPENFDVVGLYYCCAVAPASVPSNEVQLFKHFVDPQDMVLLCQEASAQRSPVSAVMLPIYIGGRDDALLSYIPGAVHTAFAALQAEVLCGSLTPSAYIQRVIAEGELRVLRASEIWDTPGLLTAQWAPYAAFTRRRWMPLCGGLDDAARLVNRDLAKSGADRTRGGVIVRRADGLYAATRPVEGGVLVFDFDSVLPAMTPDPLPVGDEVVAVYYKPAQRKGFQAESLDEALLHNGFTPHELALCFKAGSHVKHCYFLAPDGALLRYSLSSRPSFLARCSPRNDQVEAIFDNEMAEGLARENVSASTFFQGVADQMDLQVVVAGTVWGKRLRVNQRGEFLPTRCSPLYTRLTDALLGLDHHIVDSDLLGFCVVFRHAGREEYFFTDIVPKGADELLRERLTLSSEARAGDYTGYTIHGVCLIQPTHFSSSTGAGAEDVLAVNRRLISPMNLERGLTLYPGKPIYFFPIDGGVLKYHSDQTVQQIFGGTAKDRFKQLSENTLTFQDYVRGLATTGRLEVVISGGE